MNKKKTVFTLFLVMMLCMSILVGCSNDSNDEAQDNVVAVTPYGKYIGLTRDSKVVSFLGVPYAKQPVGELRWKEPQLPDESDEYCKAYEFGDTAIQPIDEFERASFAQQGEECLTLNIWTKDVNEKKPTMVFIHGGANVSGGTTDPLYHGEKFVENNDVVMVSFNYRLGPFGFLDLSEIGGKEFENSRNLGILDQLAALNWIKNNIASFGGDPDNITVFGESAGGSAIMRLMSSPMSEGLFEKAIIQSGGPASIRINGNKEVDETAQSLKVGAEFLKITGKSTIEELQSLTTSEIQSYSEQLADELGDDLDISTYGPIADDKVLPLDAFKNIKNGTGKNVKIMIGSNKDEILYFKLYDPDIAKSLEEEYKGGTILGKDFSKNIEAADKYIASQENNPQRYVDFCGEYWIRQPSMIFAELQSQYNDVFMYQWVWNSNVDGLGACHAVELAFVFGNFNAATAIAYSGENLPQSLADKTQASWTAFAASGNPSIPNEVEWPKYDLDTRATMILDDLPWKVVNDPDSDARKYMRDMYEPY